MGIRRLVLLAAMACVGAPLWADTPTVIEMSVREGQLRAAGRGGLFRRGGLTDLGGRLVRGRIGAAEGREGDQKNGGDGRGKFHSRNLHDLVAIETTEHRSRFPR